MAPTVTMTSTSSGVWAIDSHTTLPAKRAGPRLRADVARIARAEDASLVVCGHSHVPFAASDRGITVFNPGSVGPRRFQLPIVLGVIDVSAKGVSVFHIDCETGLPWKP